jgi:hypothetical protein
MEVQTMREQGRMSAIVPRRNIIVMMISRPRASKATRSIDSAFIPSARRGSPTGKRALRGKPQVLSMDATSSSIRE